MAEIEKFKYLLEKILAIELSKYFEIKAQSSLPFPGKIWLPIWFRLFFAKRAWSHVQRSESKYDIPYWNLAITGHLPVKKDLVPEYFSFAAINHKTCFNKILGRIFKFGCFSMYHGQIKSNIPMQNLMLNRLANLKPFIWLARLKMVAFSAE